jgi:N-methylhydantoinase A
MGDGDVGDTLVLAADIGGTFTDVILASRSGDVAVAKRLTTSDPTDAVIDGVRELLDRTGAAPTAIGRVVHGTTLATNVILEGRGVPVAFVGTAGFRWMLTLGRQARVEEERFDLFFDPAAPPVPLSHTFEVPERIGAGGAVVVPLDEGAVEMVASQIAGLDVAGVAICLLHSFANPDHERRVAQICREVLGPAPVIAISSDVLPEIREYERATTTLMSVYVGPVMSSYLEALTRRLVALGVTAPVHVMESSGGVMTAEMAARRAVYTIESGPAAGVVAAQHLGSIHGAADVISFDMGGTTAKVGVIRGGRPDITYEFHVGGKASSGGRRAATGIPIRLPAIDLAEVGSGGGSVAWVDGAGALLVGPRSAGSNPGPACYGLGGTDATVTDADLILGYLGAVSLGGGAMALDPARAADALARSVGVRLDVDVVTAASAVHRIVNANMGAAVHMTTVARGVDPRDFVLVSLGGAAPMHIARVAAQFGIRRVLVPPHSGVGSAMGLVTTDLRTDRSLSRVVRADRADPAELEGLLGRLAGEAGRELGEGSEVVIERSVDMRYAGQGHELNVALPALPLTGESLAATAARFYRRYLDEYGIDLRDPVELVTFRVRAVRAVGTPASPLAAAEWPARPAPVAGTRTAYFPELSGFVETSIHARPDCRPGDRITGPALVEDAETTLVLPPGWVGGVEADGTIGLQHEPAGAAPPAHPGGAGAG